MRSLSLLVRRSSRRVIGAALLLVTIGTAGVVAEETRKPMRRIYVPFEDLNVILEGDHRRVFLSDAQYSDLQERARRTAATAPPRPVVVAAAEYAGTVEEGRARVQGTIQLEVLADGVHAVPLALSGVAVQSATLDGNAASLAKTASGVTLFLEGTGRHLLTLDVHIPLLTSSARQSMHFRLPTPPATTFALTVPGNVEVKSGASVVQRTFDQAAVATTFDLAMPDAPVDLGMSLNNRLVREEIVVASRAVYAAEITESYQRLHATFSQEVLHGAAEQFRFAIPDGFDISDVSSPQLAQWQIETQGDQQVLVVSLRNPETATVLINIEATRYQ